MNNHQTRKEIIPGKYISCCKGDISVYEADAIVNAANNHLWMGSGVAGAIKRRGGQSIEAEAIARGPIAVGEAVATSGGDLKARYVIHAAAMGQDLVTSEALISLATLNSLKRAEELNLSSIAFPALGTGVGGFSVSACAEIMLATCRDFLESKTSLGEIIFVLYDLDSYEKFSNVLSKLN